jgi:hypothetical protein
MVVELTLPSGQAEKSLPSVMCNEVFQLHNVGFFKHSSVALSDYLHFSWGHQKDLSCHYTMPYGCKKDLFSLLNWETSLP